MCNINKLTKHKSVTVYKVAVKRKIGRSLEYYACLAGTPITLGPVKQQTFELYAKARYLFTDRIFFNYSFKKSSASFLFLNPLIFPIIFSL